MKRQRKDILDQVDQKKQRTNNTLEQQNYPLRTKKEILQVLGSGNIETLKTALAQVKELDLSGSSNAPLLTEKQVLLLAEALKTNSTLTQLYLGSNQIGATGGGAIAESLKINSTLTLLFFHNNQIGDAGAASLAEGTKANKTLQYLHLQQNYISDQGLELLKSNWKGNSDSGYLVTDSQSLATVQSIQAATIARSFAQKAQDYDFFNFDLVDEAFIYNLLGDGNPFADFHA